MAQSSDSYDVVIAGASLAGCTTAILLARAGARVLLAEKRSDPAAYKVVCGHFIQSSANATIRRIGLYDPMIEAGAVRSQIRIWVDGHVVGPVDAARVEPNLNLRRKKLDPLLRALTADEPGVELNTGTRVAVVAQDDSGAHVELEQSGETRSVVARLVVGADGRDSQIAEQAGIKAFRSKHGRFNYSPFYRNADPVAAPATTSWFMGKQWAGAFPTDDGLTGYYLMPTLDRLEDFKRDVEGSCLEMIAGLPETPDVSKFELAGPIVGRVDMTNIWRRPARGNVALVGDAAMSVDPLFGVGCGWAFESAALLADAVAAPLVAGDPLGPALRRYRKQYRAKFYAHSLMIANFARGRALNPGERLSFRRGARNDAVAAEIVGLASRNIKPQSLLAPRKLALLARA